MRGLLLAALLALLAGASAAPGGALPKYMSGLTPQQLVNEIESLFGKTDAEALVGARGINEALVNIFEALREKLQQGFPAYGIPPLDPLFIEHAAIDIEASSADLKGSIDNTTISGISGYVINNIDMNILKMTLAFDFLFPNFTIKGDQYDIDGVLAILPIYGTGPYEITIHDFSIVGQLKMGLVNGSVQILEIPMEIDFPALTCNMEGLMGGGEMAAIVNQMIMDLAPAIFDELKGPILDALLTAVIDFANAQMQGLTFQDIIDIILGIGGGKLLQDLPNFS